MESNCSALAAEAMRRMNDGKRSIVCRCLSMNSLSSSEYSETLARMPRWKKVLFTFLCISTCCCFGGGFCCFCGCVCCCNFCCNHCCGKYKREDDVFSSFQVRSNTSLRSGGKRLLFRTTRTCPVFVLKSMFRHPRRS